MNPVAANLFFNRSDAIAPGNWGQRERGAWEEQAFDTLFDSTLQPTSPPHLHQQPMSPAFQSTEMMTAKESIFPSASGRPVNLLHREDVRGSLPARDMPRTLPTHTPTQAHGLKAGVVVPAVELGESALSPQESKHSSRTPQMPYQVPERVIVAVVSAANVLSISIRDASLDRARYTQLQGRLQLELSWQSIALGSLSLNGYQGMAGALPSRSFDKTPLNTFGA